MRRPSTRRRGFTLLEVMLAALVLSAVLTATYNLLLQTRRVARAARAGFDQDRAIIILLRRFQATLAGALPYKHKHKELDFEGDAEDLVFTTRDYRPPAPAPGVAPDPVLAPLGPNRGRIALVHLGQDADGIYLEISPMGWTMPEQERDDETVVERLGPLKNLELAYFDGKEWKDKWEFEKALVLPKAMRATFDLEREIPGGVQVEPVRLVVPFQAERDLGVR